MNRITLPRRTAAPRSGWAHPYASSPFSPVFYADGGEDQDDAHSAEDTDDTGSPDGETGGEGQDDGDADPDGAEQLGDPGKRALDAMKDKWKSEREKRRELEAKLSAQTAPAAGEQPDTDALVRQAEQAATSKANQRIVRAEVKAAAAGKLADPGDAYRFLDLTQFEVDDDGEIDSAEVADAIDDLLKSKPYLAAQGGSKPRFEGTVDSGARKGSSRPPQLTRDDLKRMSPEDIVKAKADGRLDKALGINR